MIVTFFLFRRPRDVIIIDEEDEKPLVESLHAITKSPNITNLSFSFDSSTTAYNSTSNVLHAAKEDTIVNTSAEQHLRKTPVSQRVLTETSKNIISTGSKRNATGQFVENNNNQSKNLVDCAKNQTNSKTNNKDVILHKKNEPLSTPSANDWRKVGEGELLGVSTESSSSEKSKIGLDNKNNVEQERSIALKANKNSINKQNLISTELPEEWFNDRQGDKRVIESVVSKTSAATNETDKINSKQVFPVSSARDSSKNNNLNKQLSPEKEYIPAANTPTDSSQVKRFTENKNTAGMEPREENRALTNE